jgi:hypothetical protein
LKGFHVSQTFKNVSGLPTDIPLYGLHVDPDGTFEVPDEIADQFDANPSFSGSRVRSADSTLTPDAVSTATGPVPTIDPAPAA